MSTAVVVQNGIQTSSQSAAAAGNRGAIGSRWPEWCTLLSFIAVVAFAIPYHEPWADEAQAWQLARSLPLGTLFSKYLRYEGSPGLWHFFLWVLIRAHVSYTGLHWICGGIATAGVFLLIFKSPLPRYLRLTLPFTYFLLFQYAVVARSYVLVPLLLFTLAIWWKRSPWIVTLLLGLLANTALHAAVISGGLAIVYAIEEWRGRGFKDSGRRHKLLLCALVLIAFYAFAIWTAWPPRDLSFMGVRETIPFYLRFIGALLGPILEPGFLSIGFWWVVVMWFLARRKVHYLLPVLFFSLFCGLVHIAWWHAGLLVLLSIFLLWVTWPVPANSPQEFGNATRFVLIAMIVTQLLWSGYALYYDHYYAYSPDLAAAQFLKPYVQRGATIAVTYVRDTRPPHQTSNSTFSIHAYPEVGILPYFDRNIFANTPYPFWWWSDDDRSEARFQDLLPSHPRIVLVEFASIHASLPLGLNHPEFASLLRQGYHYRATYCGSQPQALGLGTAFCHVIFEYPADDNRSR